MDIATLLGIFAGFGLIAAAIFMGGSIRLFYDLPSIFITLGGTIASTLVNFPLSELRGVFRVTRVAFTEKLQDPEELVGILVGFAEQARREGILALENSLDDVEDEFLKKGLQLVVDGIDPEIIREILELDIQNLEERHKAGRRVFSAMGLYSPAFGMLGTLIGLIQMLTTLNDPSKIGPGMATALITTFYGAIMAYMVFLPVAGKLQARSEAEVARREMMLEGILAIQSGDNPRIVRERLHTFLPGYRKNNTRLPGFPGGVTYEERA